MNILNCLILVAPFFKLIKCEIFIFIIYITFFILKYIFLKSKTFYNTRYNNMTTPNKIRIKLAPQISVSRVGAFLSSQGKSRSGLGQDSASCSGP